MIDLTAIKSPPIETKNVVIFSTNVLAFEVAGGTESYSLSYTYLNNCLKKINISFNLDTIYIEEIKIPIQESIK